MNQVNWDFKFEPKDVYEIDQIPLDKACACDDCGEPAVIQAAEEFSWGWGKYRPLCKSCLKSMGGEL